MADMGLPLAYGAGTAADTLESILKERLLRQEYERRLAEDAAQAQYQQGMLGVAQDRNAISREQFAAEAPEREQRVRFTRIQGDTGEWKLGEAKTDAERQAAARARLAADPKMAGVITQSDAGLALKPIEPFDPTGETAFTREQQLIRARGNEQARIAAIQANAARGMIRPDINTEQGAGGVNRRVARDPITGKELWSNSYQGKQTADIVNRAEFIRQYGQLLPRLKQISLGGMSEDYGMKPGQTPTASGLNATRGIPQKALGAWNTVQGWVGNQDDLNEYESNLNGLAFMAARVMGSNSQLSDAEREAARSLFPSPYDTAETARRKWDFWDRITQAVQDPTKYAWARDQVRTQLQAVGVELDKDLKGGAGGTLNLPSSGVTIADPTQVIWQE